MVLYFIAIKAFHLQSINYVVDAARPANLAVWLLDPQICCSFPGRQINTERKGENEDGWQRLRAVCGVKVDYNVIR